jgi:hypothetical protein
VAAKTLVRSNADISQRLADVTSVARRAIGQETVHLPLRSATIAKSLGIWHETALLLELSEQPEVAVVEDEERVITVVMKVILRATVGKFYFLILEILDKRLSEVVVVGAVTTGNATSVERQVTLQETAGISLLF